MEIQWGYRPESLDGNFRKVVIGEGRWGGDEIGGLKQERLNF